MKQISNLDMPTFGRPTGLDLVENGGEFIDVFTGDRIGVRVAATFHRLCERHRPAKRIPTDVVNSTVRRRHHLLQIQSETGDVAGGNFLQLHRLKSTPQLPKHEPVHDHHDQAGNVEREHRPVKHEVGIFDSAPVRNTSRPDVQTDAQRKRQTYAEQPAHCDRYVDDFSMSLRVVVQMLQHGETSETLLQNIPTKIPISVCLFYSIDTFGSFFVIDRKIRLLHQATATNFDAKVRKTISS